MNFSSPKTVYIIGVIIFFLLVFSLFFNAPDNFPTGIILNIKEGSSLRSVSKYLEENHIIRSRVLFETFVIIFEGEKVVSGDYLFDNKIPVFEVARRLSKGERHLASIKVTIPEGFTILEISKTFASKLPNFNEDNFLKEAKEGYLFPDTYFFLTTDNEKDVLLSMGDNFEKKILSIRSEIISSGKSEKDIIIMASIIEKESKGDVDRGFISGILWKRIAMDMPLQVDADMNTYKTKGLPKNPISNPGLKAIEAAIHPKSSNYLYYLHDKDGNVHYATTFAEHKLNKFKYLK
ncbi:MAG: endolytic transglycosylase MltG [Candidatus Nomurabacteria bacterium]|nr:endolytic transglycosylase MltG [Candidatus Nomurabacteria bacterium]